MTMDLNYFNLLTGIIKVVDDGKTIEVKGIDGKTLVDTMFKVWRSNKIATSMFSKLGRTEIHFDKFFLLDVIYTLDQIVKSPYTRGAPRRTVNKVLEALLATPTAVKALGDIKPPSIINYSKLDKLDVTLFDYQMKFLDVYSDKTQRLGLNGYLLSAKPGAGKTINSLALMETLDSDTIVVIAPKKSINTVWQSTFDTVYHEKQTYYISDGKHKLVPGLNKYVFHYETLGDAVDFLMAHRDKMGKLGIILDECHNFNEINSERTQRFISLCTGNGRVQEAENVLWMSGTPLKALGKEVIPLIKTIDRSFSPRAEAAFVQIFGKNAGRALDILANRLDLMSYKVEKIDAIKTTLHKEKIIVQLKNGNDYTLISIRDAMVKFITERTKYYQANMSKYVQDYFNCIDEYKRTISSPQQKEDLEIYLRNTAQIRKAYDPVLMKDMSVSCNNFEKKTIMPNLSNPSKHVFRKAKSVYKYYNLTIAGECLGTVLGKARTQCNVDMINALLTKCIYENYAGTRIETTLPEIINNAEKKTLMFSSFVSVVETMGAQLESLGFNPVLVYGETNNFLKQNIDKFHKDESVNPCIATFPSLSEAVPVTAASQVIMLNAPYRFIHWDQAVRRAYRIGQDKDVNAIDVTLDTGKDLNITTRGVDILKWSEEQVSILMGEKKVDLVSIENFDLFDVNCFSRAVKYNYELSKNADMCEELCGDLSLEDFGHFKPFELEVDCTTEKSAMEPKNKVLDW